MHKDVYSKFIYNTKLDWNWSTWTLDSKEFELNPDSSTYYVFFGLFANFTKTHVLHLLDGDYVHSGDFEYSTVDSLDRIISCCRELSFALQGI